MADENKTSQETNGAARPEPSRTPSDPLSFTSAQKPGGCAHALKLSDEELQWARQLSSPEEVLTDLQTMRQQGNQQLDDFISELERLVSPQ
jgi:hypothetical protein